METFVQEMIPNVKHSSPNTFDKKKTDNCYSPGFIKTETFQLEQPTADTYVCERHFPSHGVRKIFGSG